MTGQNLKLHPESRIDSGEVGGGCHQHHQGLEAAVGQAPDVLQLIALLDEADEVLDPPAGDIGENNVPDRPPATANVEVGQDHQRLLAEAFDHDQSQYPRGLPRGY